MGLLYCVVIASSSIFSVVWHVLREPRGFVYYMDYGLAVLWTTLELTLASASTTHLVLLVLCLNVATVTMNHECDRLARLRLVSYEVGHSLWHLASSLKCAYIAYLVVLAEIPSSQLLT